MTLAGSRHSIAAMDSFRSGALAGVLRTLMTGAQSIGMQSIGIQIIGIQITGLALL